MIPSQKSWAIAVWVLVPVLVLFWLYGICHAGLNDGLVAYYPFNGNANDASGNGNNGTVHGATLTFDRFGNSNSAYYFDGSNNFIEAQPVNLHTGDNFTVALWLKFEMQPYRIWAMYFNTDGGWSGFHALLNTDQWGFHDTQCGLFDNGNAQNHFDISAYQDQWFHMVTVYDASLCTLISYMNGIIVDIKTPCYFPFSSTGLYIGQPNPGWAGDSYYKGALDDIRIYNRALSPAEIQTLSGNSVNVPPPYVFGQKSNSGLTSEPVNTALGNYTYEHVDLKLAGSPVLEFRRGYNSQDVYQGPLGNGWTHSYNIVLSAPDNQIATVKHGDGHDEYYTLNSNGTFSPAHGGIYSTLVKNQDGTYTVKDKTQKIYNFGTDAKLVSIVDKNGNTISCAYSGGNLTSVTGPGGRILSFAYDASNRITGVTDPLGRSLSYAYDSSGNLSSYTDANGGVWAYQYDAAHHIAKISNPRGKTLVSNVYSGSQVVSQTNGRGSTTSFQYNTPNPGDTTISGPLGNKTVHTHDANYQLLKETDALGNFISYTYDANGNRTKVTDKRGNSTQYTYDTMGNVTSKTDALGKMTSISYDGMNNPLSVTEIGP